MGRGRPKTIQSHRLTPEERGRAIGMKEAGMAIKSIARTLKCSPNAIRKLLKKYDSKGTIKDLPKDGRPRKTSPREDRTMKFESLQNRKASAKALALKRAPNFVKNRISKNTVKRRLVEAGLNGRVARKKPLLSKKNIKARYQWAKDHLDWTEDDWKNVIFSDESPFQLFQSGGRIFVRRRPGEEFLPECMNPTVKHGGGSIQVWGAFSYNGVGPIYRVQGIMTGEKYRQILKTHMAPFLKKITDETGKKQIFQHDNDPKHSSKVVKAYLSNKQLVVLQWPSQSPDMNPIEHMWRQIKSQIYARSDKASNLDDVFEIAKEEWKMIPTSFIQSLIKSMPNRVLACYKNHGNHTKY
jgi:transposase